jgi:chromosome segregation ATPase
VAKLKTELDAANSKTAQLQDELDRDQSQLKEQQGHEQELTGDLEKARKEAGEQLAADREASQRQLQSLTDDTTKKLSESEKQVSDLTEQLKSVSADRDAAKSKLDENQTQLEAMRNELVKAQAATEQAVDAEAQRIQTQSALDQANKEIEQLRTQLEQQTPPPVSVSPAPEEAPALRQ